jgi:hypothetical protein
MMLSTDILAAGLEAYKSVALDPRPQFIDEQPGVTRIRMVDEEFLLQMGRNMYSITSPDGDRLEYSYGDDDVTIKMMKSEKEVFAFYWHFRDPDAYRVEMTVNGSKVARDVDHNSFGGVAGELLALHRADLPASQAFRRYAAWFTLSDDFKFEVTRRIAAYLPTGYFKAMKRARTVNMAACSIGCFMAGLSLVAVPGTPDDWFWIALCGSCAGM